SLEDRLPAAGGHARTKPVLALAAADVRLVRALHGGEEPFARTLPAPRGRGGARSIDELCEAPVIHNATEWRPVRNGCSRGTSVARAGTARTLVHTCGDLCGDAERSCKSCLFRDAALSVRASDAGPGRWYARRSFVPRTEHRAGRGALRAPARLGAP